MIDDPLQVSLLELVFKDAVPIQARLSGRLQAVLAKNSLQVARATECTIEEITYAGDEGGFMCVLRPTAADAKQRIVSAITLLVFDPRHPLTREMATYQRRRVKRLKRLDREPWRAAA